VPGRAQLPGLGRARRLITASVRPHANTASPAFTVVSGACKKTCRSKRFGGEVDGATLPIGRYINNLGPQKTSYLPQGLPRADGDNTLAIAEWSLAPGAGGLGQVSLVPCVIERGGIPVRGANSTARG
jgi:hypothetical protein